VGIQKTDLQMRAHDEEEEEGILGQKDFFTWHDQQHSRSQIQWTRPSVHLILSCIA